jgi:hypothetical protein
LRSEPPCDGWRDGGMKTRAFVWFVVGLLVFMLVATLVLDGVA